MTRLLPRWRSDCLALGGLQRFIPAAQPGYVLIKPGVDTAVARRVVLGLPGSALGVPLGLMLTRFIGHDFGH